MINQDKSVQSVISEKANFVIQKDLYNSFRIEMKGQTINFKDKGKYP